MSTLGDRIGSPTARTSRTALLANVSTMSRSWIIRSSTTSTSSARGVNTLSRCASKNMGRFRFGSTASTAGLNRSRCPGCKMRPPRSGARNQIVSFSQTRRQRLFHQQVQPGIEQRRGHLMMLDGWHGHDCGIQLQIRLQQFVDG